MPKPPIQFKIETVELNSTQILYRFVSIFTPDSGVKYMKNG